MAVLKYLIPAFAATKYAFAQGPCSGTTTLASNADASALAACPTWDGSIAIATEVAESIQLPAGLIAISEDLVASNASGLTGLSGSVRRIGGAFRLQIVNAITSLSFPSLTEVGEIDWLTINDLNALDFGTPGVATVDRLSIQDTGLFNLDGLSPMQASDILISNNGGLTRVEMQLANVTGNVTFDSNGSDNLDLRMPDLAGAGAMSINGCGNIQFPSLENVNGSAEFFNNPNLQTLALSNLTQAGGVRVTNNGALTNLSLPVLTTIMGPINVQENENLVGTISFPDLQTVRGAIRVTGGNWEDFDLPAIQIVTGAFNISSTQDINQVCNRYNGIRGRNNVIRGTFTCRNGANPDGSGGSASSNSDSGTGAASSLFNAASVGTLGALGVIVAVFAQF